MAAGVVNSKGKVYRENWAVWEGLSIGCAESWRKDVEEKRTNNNNNNNTNNKRVDFQ